MGGTSWSSESYDSLKSSYREKSTDEIFERSKSRSIMPEMDPKGITFREARDSEVHPNTVAIIIGLDETGSMGKVPDKLIRDELDTLMDTLIKHKVEDAAVLFMGIGDHSTDDAPLQVGQFESGTQELNKWLSGVWLEKQGGPYGRESYLLAWLLAARHTSIDCFEKRGKKGYLFTIGDENNHRKLDENFLKEALGYKQAEDLTAEQLLAEAQRTYHVFHIHVNHDHTEDEVIREWQNTLKQNFIIVNDYTTIAAVIASTIATIEGAKLEDVLKSLDKSTAVTVKNSIVNAVKTTNEGTVDEGVVVL